MAAQTEHGADALTFLQALPQDDLRHEMIDGDHLVTPTASYPHQWLVNAMVRALDIALVEKPEAVYAGGNVATPDGRSLVIPDVVVTRRRLQGLVAEPQDVALVVEVSSPSTRKVDLTRKAALYGAWGVGYWVVDQPTRSVMVYDGARVAALLEGDDLIGGHGIRTACSVDALFS